MAIPANIAVGWPSTAASIPTGWTRETSLDSRYILGAAAGADSDLATNRGNATHTHTSPSHAPTQQSHAHLFSAPGNDGASIVGGALGGGNAAEVTHGHNAEISDFTTAINDGVSITVDVASNDLAYKEVIWIKSDGSPAELPSGCVAFFEADTLPTGWSRAYGNTYLKGAAPASDGGATGGSMTHTHTSPAHTHTQQSHNHASVVSAPGNFGVAKGTGAVVYASVPHRHNIALQGVTATNQSVTTTIDSSNHEPPYTKLNVLLSASATTPVGIICLWLGLNSAIPSGWSRYTLMDGRWLKNANADGESGVSTGGAAVHGHTASDCAPVQNSHTHAVTDTGTTGSTTGAATGTTNLNTVNHTHAWTVDAETAVNDPVAVLIDNISSGEAYPPHRTVIYVKFVGGGGPPPACYTSYDIGRFDIGSPEAQLLPEVAKKIAQGDLRYVPR